jgi:hypothetical protein
VAPVAPPITPTDPDAVAQQRCAKVHALLDGNHEMIAWIQNFATQLETQSYFIADDFMEKSLSLKLAVEVKKAWRAGKLDSGKLGGGLTGKNTRYTLADIRGDKVQPHSQPFHFFLRFLEDMTTFSCGLLLLGGVVFWRPLPRHVDWSERSVPSHPSGSKQLLERYHPRGVDEKIRLTRADGVIYGATRPPP